MDAAVGADDEANFDFQARVCVVEDRIGRGERFGRLGLFALRAGAGVRHVGKLRAADRRLLKKFIPQFRGIHRFHAQTTAVPNRRERGNGG